MEEYEDESLGDEFCLPNYDRGPARALRNLLIWITIWLFSLVLIGILSRSAWWLIKLGWNLI